VLPLAAMALKHMATYTFILIQIKDISLCCDILLVTESACVKFGITSVSNYSHAYK